jgi:hypothetical protein
MPFSGMLLRVALVGADVSGEHVTSIVGVAGVGELGTMLAVTSSPILVILMMGVMRSSEMSVLEEPHGLGSQKMTFFMITAVLHLLSKRYPRLLNSPSLITFTISGLLYKL